MNLVKGSLVERGTKGRVEVSGGVKALVKASLLSTLNLLTRLWLANSSYFPIKLAGGLTQKLCQARDPRAVAIKI